MLFLRLFTVSTLSLMWMLGCEVTQKTWGKRTTSQLQTMLKQTSTTSFWKTLSQHLTVMVLSVNTQICSFFCSCVGFLYKILENTFSWKSCKKIPNEVIWFSVRELYILDPFKVRRRNILFKQNSLNNKIKCNLVVPRDYKIQHTHNHIFLCYSCCLLMQCSSFRQALEFERDGNRKQKLQEKKVCKG